MDEWGCLREADQRLLSKLAAYNRGIARRVYEEAHEDIVDQITGFFRELSSPLMRDVRIKYLDEEVDMRSLVTQQGPSARTYWDGSEVLVAGRLKKTVRKTMGVEVEGVNMAGKSMTLSSGGTVRRLEPETSGGFLERIWAFLQIKDLLRSAESTVSARKRAQYKSKALSLAKKYNYVTDETALLVIPLEVEGSTAAEVPNATLPTTRFFAPEGGVKKEEERSAVVRIVEEVAVTQRLGSGSKHQPSVIAGAPKEEAVVRVDSIRAELGPGSEDPGNPSSQNGILEQNAIAIDPLSNVDLRTLIGIANSKRKGISAESGIWRNSYVGPPTSSVQGYARLFSSLDPGTRHAAARLRPLATNCQPRAQRDILLVLDVHEEEGASLGGPATPFLLRSIAQRLISALAFSPHNSRIGIMLFSPNADKAEMLYKFSQNQNPNALISIIGKIDTSAMKSKVYYNAFNLAYDVFREEGRDEAEKVIVLFSSRDSYGSLSNLTSRHRTIAESLRGRGVQLLAVAPHQTNPAKLAQLGYVTGSSELVFSEPGLDGLLSAFCNNFLPPRS